MSDKFIVEHVDLCSVLSCIDKSCNFPHVSSGEEGRFKNRPFFRWCRKYPLPFLLHLMLHYIFSLIPLHNQCREVYPMNPSFEILPSPQVLTRVQSSLPPNHFTQFGQSQNLPYSPSSQKSISFRLPSSPCGQEATDWFWTPPIICQNKPNPSQLKHPPPYFPLPESSCLTIPTYK